MLCLTWNLLHISAHRNLGNEGKILDQRILLEVFVVENQVLPKQHAYRVAESGFPSETCRVLKENEMWGFGECQTRRLVLEALTREELKQAGWPKKRERLARAILLVSLYGGAHDIADDTPVNRARLKQRESHHLFPMAYLRTQGYDDNHIKW